MAITLKNDQFQGWSQFNSHPGGSNAISGDTFIASNFTPSVTGNLVSIRTSVDKIGTPGGALVMEIFATSSGQPTGASLASESIAEASVPDKGLVTFTFSSPPALTSGTVYAIVMSHADGLGSSPDFANRYRVGWSPQDFIGSGITDYFSTDAGSSWSNNSSKDMAFLTTMDTPVATPGIDQFAFNTNSNEFISTSATEYAQTFTPSVNGLLKKLRMFIRRFDGQTAGNVTFHIQGVSAGEPDGIDLASEIIADTLLGTNDATSPIEVTFSTPANLVASTQYAIVVKFPNASGSARYLTQVFNGADGDIYSGGRAFKSTDSGANWGDLLGSSGTDLGFVTLMEEIDTKTQTIDSDATILVETTKTIDSDAFVGQETIQIILSDAGIGAAVEQTINADTFIGLETTKTIDSDTVVLASPTQTIDADTIIQATVEQTIDSDALILVSTVQTIGSKATVATTNQATIDSDAVITVRQPELKLFSSANPAVEIGISTNPIVFSGILAGETTEHPDNPFFLWNDKDGVLNSVDAREVTVDILSLNIIDELVGISTGAIDQTFTVAFDPVVDDENDHPLVVKVNGVAWTRVENFVSSGQFDEHYVFDFLLGEVTFGDDINGAIPPTSGSITISYTPDQVGFGAEIEEFNWFGVQSLDVISNNVVVDLERQISSDTNTVQVGHTPVTSVTAVWLDSDPNKLGTDFFAGGSFIADSGIITLGTSLPGANTGVLVDYEYTIEDDLESDFTQIGGEIIHEFPNPIPSNNAKKILFRLVPPATASPSGIMNIKFKLRIKIRA